LLDDPLAGRALEFGRVPGYTSSKSEATVLDLESNGATEWDEQ
jgi:hypothetical protein